MLILSISAYSQAVENLFTKNIDIHFDPLPLGFPDPSLRFGSEMMLGGRWSVGLNAGVGFHGMYFRKLPLVENHFGKNYRQLDIRPELKFYWLKREKMGWYLATEGLVSSLKSAVLNGTHTYSTDTPKDTVQISFDRASYKKTKAGFVLKVGVRHLIAKRITTDFFTGIGLSKTNSSYSNYTNRKEISYDPFFEMENFDIGKRVTPHISLGFRIGFILWSEKRSHQ